ncbi:MAG: hypothetical protein IPM59_09730 [Chloracidobacterium sp.]|nr:hypothetical protein [Chloracidobacterium sp.]
MSITEIEAAIERLPRGEVDKLMSWLEEYQARAWDEEIAGDYEAGRLDSLIAEAFESGEPSPLTPDDLAEARRIVNERITARSLVK